MTPIVSIIIPVYNGEKWIADTINSVFAQTFIDYELIVINDGSTDNTESIILGFGDILFYRKKTNGGQASARNLGIKLSRGEYIAFLDSDDLWIPDKLIIQYSQLLSSGYKWSYSNALAFEYDKSTPIFNFDSVNKQYQGLIFDKLILNCFIPSPTLLIHKSIFEKVGYFNEDKLLKNREDWNMWLRIAQYFPIDYVNIPLAYYRLHSNSVTASENRDDAIKGYIYALNLAVELDSDIFINLKNKLISDKYFLESRYMSLNFNYYNSFRYAFTAIYFNPFNIILNLYLFVILFYPFIKFMPSNFKIIFKKQKLI
jgi:glycosyltransferase involved in cell wall biosynthesis